MTALFLSALLAQAPERPTAPGRVIAVEDGRDEAYRIGKLLRCPVCQGMPIAESPAPMAQDMMRRVREMVAAGKTREEILAYFEKSYEGWVRLEPKREGANWALWLVPPLLLLAGLAFLGSYLRRHAPRAQTPASATPDDYLRRVRDEVGE